MNIFDLQWFEGVKTTLWKDGNVEFTGSKKGVRVPYCIRRPNQGSG